MKVQWQVTKCGSTKSFTLRAKCRRVPCGGLLSEKSIVCGDRLLNCTIGSLPILKAQIATRHPTARFDRKVKPNLSNE
jgi:hypothetical protein